MSSKGSRLDYKTVLVSSVGKPVMAFYKYNHGIGFVPCETTVTSRGRTYTTADLMYLIHTVFMSGARLPRHGFGIDTWTAKGARRKFVEFCKELESILSAHARSNALIQKHL